jgi:hypothetical protein
VALLPNVDQGPLFSRYNPNLPVTNVANQPVVATFIPVYACPSDSYSVPQNLCTVFGVNMGRGNIGASGYGQGAGAQDWVTVTNALDRGLFGHNSFSGIRDCTDGSSNTVASWEVRAGWNPGDPRGVWANGRAGGGLMMNCLNPSPTGAFGTGDCYGINEGMIPGHCCGDDIYTNNQPLDNVPIGMGGWNGGEGQAGPKSLHTGGVHALMTDGAVKFINNNLNGNTMRAIMSISGNDIVPGNSF